MICVLLLTGERGGGFGAEPYGGCAREAGSGQGDGGAAGGRALRGADRGDDGGSHGHFLPEGRAGPLQVAWKAPAVSGRTPERGCAPGSGWPVTRRGEG